MKMLWCQEHAKPSLLWKRGSAIVLSCAVWLPLAFTVIQAAIPEELSQLKSLSPCIEAVFQADEFSGCTAQAVLVAQKRWLRTGRV